tara:strand:- start:402 stop:563 length:162 start_codon:yes stop_codon:yes gene_type:complete
VENKKESYLNLLGVCQVLIKAYFTCAAWFKFFWTEAFIDVEVQINGTWVDVED